jgi:hypothetical protein
MAEVQRLLWLMLMASALVWAGALVDFGGAHAPKQAATSAAAPSASEAARDPLTARDEAARTPASRAASEPERSPTTPSPGSATPGTTPPRPGQGGVYVIGKPGSGSTAVPAAVTAAATPAPGAQDEALRGELGEGVISPEYAAIEQDYVLETRDGPWAMAEEKNLRSVLSMSDIATQVALVSCQGSVCRLVLQTGNPDAFQQLLQVPGLAAMTGLTASTPYSLRGGQLSVYFRRR